MSTGKKTTTKTGKDQEAPKKRRPNRTSWKAGQSGNPKGRPKSGEALSEVLRSEISPLGILKRMQALADNAQSETVRYHALAWLAERGWGKAPLEVNFNQHNPYASRLKGLTVEQLEALAAIDEPVDLEEAQEPNGEPSPVVN